MKSEPKIRNKKLQKENLKKKLDWKLKLRTELLQ